MNMNRREAIDAAVLTGAAAVGVGTALLKDRLGPPPEDPRGAQTVRQVGGLAGVEKQPAEDMLMRMQRELATAMKKPMEERLWIMIIDTRKCIGCDACTIGCVAENKLPPGVVYRPVIKEESGTYPHVRLDFTPRPCMQCENPSCVPVCPVKATWKRPDGVTVIDYDKCIGCRYCLTACPYGARTSDFGIYYTQGAAEGASQETAVLGNPGGWEHQPNHEYGKSWLRKGHDSPMGNARKCHFCLHRLEIGELPMCVTTCVGRATYFGDKRDEKSLVVEILNQHRVQTLLVHHGNKPKVYYIV